MSREALNIETVEVTVLPIIRSQNNANALDVTMANEMVTIMPGLITCRKEFGIRFVIHYPNLTSLGHMIDLF